MAPRSCIIRQSLYVNPPANPTGEQNKLAGAQSLAKKSDINSDKALIPSETPTLSLVSPPAEDLFTKFMKVFVETTQVQALAKPQEPPLKAKTLKTYGGKFHMECYHFCQQCEDYFKISSAIGTNCTLFVALFLNGSISLK